MQAKVKNFQRKRNEVDLNINITFTKPLEIVIKQQGPKQSDIDNIARNLDDSANTLETATKQATEETKK